MTEDSASDYDVALSRAVPLHFKIIASVMHKPKNALEIAQECQVSTQRTRASLKILKHLGLVVQDKRRKTHLNLYADYYLYSPSGWTAIGNSLAYCGGGLVTGPERKIVPYRGERDKYGRFLGASKEREGSQSMV